MPCDLALSEVVRRCNEAHARLARLRAKLTPRLVNRPDPVSP
jgi:hypothetical protein